LAKLLAEEFNWNYISVGHLWRDLWKQRYPNGEISFEEFWVKTTDEENLEMDKRIGEVIKQGHYIADLRYGFLHRDPKILIVFTFCDINVKVNRALEKNAYPGKGFEEIKQIIEQREKDEVDRSLKLYGQDYRDPKNYDIKFDTTNSPPEEALNIITQFKP
jgi:cytidylate kinase